MGGSPNIVEKGFCDKFLKLVQTSSVSKKDRFLMRLHAISKEKIQEIELLDASKKFSASIHKIAKIENRELAAVKLKNLAVQYLAIKSAVVDSIKEPDSINLETCEEMIKVANSTLSMIRGFMQAHQEIASMMQFEGYQDGKLEIVLRQPDVVDLTKYYNLVTDRDVQEILENHPHITDLTIASSQFTYNGAAFAIKLAPQLERLKLIWCRRISSKTVVKLCKELKHLKMLDMGWCLFDSKNLPSVRK